MLAVRKKLQQQQQQQQQRGGEDETGGKTPNLFVSFAEHGACFAISDRENVELNWLKGGAVFNQYSGGWRDGEDDA